MFKEKYRIWTLDDPSSVTAVVRNGGSGPGGPESLSVTRGCGEGVLHPWPVHPGSTPFPVDSSIRGGHRGGGPDLPELVKGKKDLPLDTWEYRSHDEKLRKLP